MSGAQIGRIRDFQFAAQLRLVLKPIMIKLPVVGGIQAFFLNTPDITFDLEGISGIPGFSYFIRQKIEERLTKKFVFPNKITKRFLKEVEAAELKSLEPAGVLRVHVFEAKNLEEKDVTGKSDPYAILNVGAQEYKTKAVKRELNPKWDYWCEFIILDPYEQYLQFKLFDKDAFNEDEFLGSGLVEVHSVIKEDESDKWFQLDHAKHGEIHLRFTWLNLSADSSDLDEALNEAKALKVNAVNTALLTLYLDMAEDLEVVKSKKPHPYVLIAVGEQRQKSKVKKHTCDPIWEQGFSVLVPNPEEDALTLTVVDKHSDVELGSIQYNLRSLFDMPCMQTSKEVLPLSTSGRIVISLQLRILKSGTLESDDESESSSDDDDVPFRREVRLSKSKIVSRSQSAKSLKKSPKADHKQPSISSTDEKKSDTEELFTKSKAQGVTRAPSMRTKPELGQMELTISYSAPRQKLIVTVHRITNLPSKENDPPDAYVKIKLISPVFQKLKSKTKVIVDSCDPVFEETFEYLVSESDLPNSKLVLTAKSKKVFFNSDIIGQVVIDFKKFHDVDEPVREWFELQHSEDSD
ncbi:unnamed protein product [Acanthoscelides obtectus]|nr:unnamed protein product [Acanthoscelides obtectus]CAK1653028.1 Extended synaptotagmin-2 [Acanthoscelides obtectus]